MKIKKLLTDDDNAVSPVIGVILMVAITVVLAAVIASFVLGLGEEQQDPPKASFEFEYDTSGSGDPSVDITHESGDSLEQARLTVLNDGSSVGGSWDGSDEVTSGDGYGSFTAASGNTISVVWKDADEETSTTLAESEVP